MKLIKQFFCYLKFKHDVEIKKGLKNSKLKTFKIYEYDTEPTELTKQIEKITNYKIRNKI